MDILKRTLIILLLSLFVSGCVTKRACDRKFPPQIIRVDSLITITKTFYRDTTIFVYLKPDTIRDTVEVIVREGIANSRKSFHETDLSWSMAQVVDGKLIHELRTKDTAIALMIENAIRESATLTENKTSKTIIQKVNELTGWQHFQVWLGRILALLLLLYLGFIFVMHRVKIPE